MFICHTEKPAKLPAKGPVHSLLRTLTGSFIALCFLAHTPGISCAQWTMGGRNIAMARASAALAGDAWAIFHNPALIDPGHTRLGLFTMRYYGLKELEDQALAISIPLRSSPSDQSGSAAAVAAGIHSYGFKLYRETQIRAGGSFHWNRYKLGVNSRYVHRNIDHFGSGGFLLWDAGLGAELTRGVIAGFRILNIFHQGAGDDAWFPSEMALGISREQTRQWLLSAELVKDVMHPYSFRFGTEWNLADGLLLRGGWSTRPFIWTTGAGIYFSRIMVNFAVEHHDVLGLSPGIDCILIF